MENIEESRKSIKKMMADAIKGEMEAEELYTNLSESSESIFLMERFKFLAREEEEDRKVLERLANTLFPEGIEIPDESGLPLPKVRVGNKGAKMPLYELIDVIEKAKDAEKKIHDIYVSMSLHFEEGSPERKMLEFLAFLKMDHYIMFERKIEKLEKFGIV